MKILQTEITKDTDSWTCIITNGNGLKVIIEGMETKEIAKKQAKNRIKEMKKAGLL